MPLFGVLRSLSGLGLGRGCGFECSDVNTDLGERGACEVNMKVVTRSGPGRGLSGLV